MAMIPTTTCAFRDIRAEGILYVVDEVIEGPGGTSYIACGKIRRLVQ
jgi:Ca-activated chloride channel family protein